MERRSRGTDLNTSKTPVEARHVNVRNRPKGCVRNRRLEVQTGRRLRRVLIVGRHVEGKLLLL